MKIAFAVLPGYGHVYPVMPLALACAAAGHDVVIATGAPFLQRLPLPTVNQLPDGVDLQWAAGAGPERAAAQRIRADIDALPAPATVVPALVDFAQRR